MSTLMEIIKERRKEQSTRPIKKKVGRLCKMHGDYYHAQTLLHKDEREALLNRTGENMQESIRMAITFYLENKKDD